MIGFISGAFSGFITTPFDVIKTRKALDVKGNT